MINNADIVRRYIDAGGTDDLFWYTELLDRNGNGSARFKMLRTFEHISREQFDEQMPTIIDLCEKNGVRAYTRLSPRSRKRVAAEMLKRVTQEFIDGHYALMGRIYASVVGTTHVRNRQLWLFDVDEPLVHATRLGHHMQRMAACGALVGTVPSRKGYHIMAHPFDINRVLGCEDWKVAMSLHKDNPTNLYIPESAK